MSQSLVNSQDSRERQNEKLLKITKSLMHRIEQGTDTSGIAYAQFERAILLEEEVRSRTSELKHALDLLNESNARLEQANIKPRLCAQTSPTALKLFLKGLLCLTTMTNWS